MANFFSSPGVIAKLPAASDTFENFFETGNVPENLAIDGAGNIWVANEDIAGNEGLTEMIGAAVPVRTPSIGPPAKP